MNTTADRPTRLLAAFASHLEDHRKDFDGFLRDIENVRFGRASLDHQQIARCEYALRNIDLLLENVEGCIQSGLYKGDDLDTLVQTKNDWTHMRGRAHLYMGVLIRIVSEARESVRPLRQALEAHN